MGLPDERALIDQLTAGLHPRRNRAGFVSDCAIVPFGDEELVVSVDSFARATHFPEGLAANQAGRLAAGATLADLAAAGAEVVGILAAYGIPGEADRDEIQQIADAIAAVAEGSGGEILGGDTKPRGELTLTLTGVGRCPADEAMLRDRARPGDRVLVTGALGGAGAALDRIASGMAPTDADPLVPDPRLQAGQRLREAGVRCAMDLSDGLADAATAIARASGVRVRIEAEAIPLHPWARSSPDGLAHALGTGGDYELVAAVAGDHLAPVRSRLEELGLEVAVVGSIEEGQGAILERDSEAVELDRGYEHAFDRSEPRA